MSDFPSLDRGRAGRPQHVPDVVRLRFVVAVGTTTLVLFALATAASTAIYLRGRGSVPAAERAAEPVAAGRTVIGIVDQLPFEVAGEERSRREAERRRLGSYGWVDRDRGLVHVPIERAFDRIVAEEGGR